MQISIPDSFRCYISGHNNGRQFINKYVLYGECYGVELQVEKSDDVFNIYLIPLPKQYSTIKKECDFYERCLEKLSKPELAQYIDDSKPWFHAICTTCQRKLLNSDIYRTALRMTFRLGSEVPEERITEYKKMMGLI